MRTTPKSEAEKVLELHRIFHAIIEQKEILFFRGTFSVMTYKIYVVDYGGMIPGKCKNPEKVLIDEFCYYDKKY